MAGCFLVQGDCRALRDRNDNYWCFGVVLCKEIASSFVPLFSQRQYLWFGGCFMLLMSSRDQPRLPFLR